jgi:hypothetical protein
MNTASSAEQRHLDGEDCGGSWWGGCRLCGEEIAEDTDTRREVAFQIDFNGDTITTEAWWVDDGGAGQCNDYTTTTLGDDPTEALRLAVAWLAETVGVKLPEAVAS